MNQNRSFLWLVAIFAVCLSVVDATLGIDAGSQSRQSSAWEIGTLATAGDVGRYCDVRIDGAGDMHVVYFRADTEVIHAISRENGVWQTPDTIDGSGTAVGHCSISAKNSGVLRFSWCRSGTITLMYAGPENVNTWETGNVISSADDVGRNLSTYLTDTGVLSIACRNNTEESLIFATRDAGGAWSMPDTVDFGPHRGFFADHTYRSGAGYAFCEQDNVEQTLLYADSTSIMNKWQTGEIISSPDDIGLGLSLFQRDTGELSVACRNDTRGALLFTIRDGMGVWSVPDTVDSGPNRGLYADHMHRSGGGYAFSERDDGEGMLLYVDPDLKSNNWKIGTVRTAAQVGPYVSATRMPDGHVACSYYTYDPTLEGSVQVAYNVGLADFWVVRSIADSIAISATAPVASDLVIISGWQGFVSFRHDIDGYLYYAYNDSVTTGIGEDTMPGEKPLAFTLRPNYPNPFNPRTTISYTIRETGRVHLAVYGVAGGLVRVLVDDVKLAGEHKVTWDGANQNGGQAASGVYFVRLSAGGQLRARKLVMVR
jgi:hypothetical protein